MLECEIYPVWNVPGRYRRLRRNQLEKAQQNLNDKNTKKKLIRLINTNFVEEEFGQHSHMAKIIFQDL
jgi:hypothetical protein